MDRYKRRLSSSDTDSPKPARKQQRLGDSDVVYELNMTKQNEDTSPGDAQLSQVFHQMNEMKTDILKSFESKLEETKVAVEKIMMKGVVNCQNSRDKGPPLGNSARG